MPGPRATIFINASSGFDTKEGAPEKLRALFEGAGIEADVHYVKAGVNLKDLAREAVAQGSTIVVAGGGDGTLSATAAGVAGTDTAFGVLPVGTLNHFARDLKIPLELEAAAQVILDRHVSHVDVAEVNGKIFLNNSILGLYPIYRYLKAAEERRGWGKRMAFWRAVAAAFWRLPKLRVKLFVGGREIERKTSYILIANNEHAMEGYRLGTRESLTEGKLWIYVLKQQGRWGLVRILVSLIFGQFRARDSFEVFSSEELWVDSQGKKLGVALDGEVTALETPLRYRILPCALNVLTPDPQEVPGTPLGARVVDVEAVPATQAGVVQQPA